MQRESLGNGDVRSSCRLIETETIKGKETPNKIMLEMGNQIATSPENFQRRILCSTLYFNKCDDKSHSNNSNTNENVIRNSLNSL